MSSGSVVPQIRRATPKDVAAIRACARAAYAQYVAAIGREPAPMVADFENQISDGFVWVADIDGDVSGFIVFFAKPDTMFLENVAMHPAHAGKGVGRQLILFCENAARAAGLPSVKLYTNAKMSENLSLYPRLGYRETERRLEDGFDRVYFEKTL